MRVDPEKGEEVVTRTAGGGRGDFPNQHVLLGNAANKNKNPFYSKEDSNSGVSTINTAFCTIEYYVPKLQHYVQPPGHFNVSINFYM